KDAAGRFYLQMSDRRRVRFALLAVTFAAAIACAPEEIVTISPTPAAARATPASTAVPTRTTTPTTTTVATAAPATAAPTPSTAPGGTPNTACAPRSGGGSTSAAPLTGDLSLVAVRAAHNAGFDRVVFEWSGTGIPEYRVELASTFTAPSGQPVRVDGNAFFVVRMAGQAHTTTPPTVRSYPQPDPYHVALP